MDILNMDANMLLSIINMKLRDNYNSLGDLCDDMDISEVILVKKLASIDYHYCDKSNQFK